MLLLKVVLLLIMVMWCRGDKATEYSRKLEYLKREEEMIKEEELEAEALLQPSQPLQVEPCLSFGQRPCFV